MRQHVIIAVIVAATCAGAPVRADGMRCAGIAGNSGEQDATLVRFGPSIEGGLGVVCDRYGSLWSRGGAGVLNRYAPDGRLLAAYKIPKDPPNRTTDAIALVNDTIILRLGKGLHVLPIDAPAGSEAKPLNVEADHMSPSAREGWVAAAKGVEIFLVNLAGERKPVATIKKPPMGVELGGDGSVYCWTDSGIQKVASEAPDGLVPGPGIGERPRFLDCFWYGGSWHGTLRRFDAELRPDPGVVLGGGSGAFIGHVDEQAEVVNPRGLAKISPTLFAVSGMSGVIHLLEWKEREKRFDVIRRVGATPVCNALCLDRDGRFWHLAGNWNWGDGPASPLRSGIPQPEHVFGLAVLDSDAVTGYGYMWGKPTIISGKMDKEVRLDRIEKQTALPKTAVGVAVAELAKRRVLLVLEADGKVTAAQLGGNGEYQGDAGTVQLASATPVKEWTSIAAPDKDTLLAAGDGFVIEFARDGDNWKEARRWNSWGDGAEAKFGGKIWLAYDAGRVWVSDSERHRVICFTSPDKKLVGIFGTLDVPGDSLAALHTPRTIAARGDRAVLFDSGNQRIVKLNTPRAR